MKMENAETVEIGIPDKSCGVSRCSDCSSSYCRKRTLAKRAEVARPVQEISSETIERFSARTPVMNDLFISG